MFGPLKGSQKRDLKIVKAMLEFLAGFFGTLKGFLTMVSKIAQRVLKFLDGELGPVRTVRRVAKGKDLFPGNDVRENDRKLPAGAHMGLLTSEISYGCQ